MRNRLGDLKQLSMGYTWYRGRYSINTCRVAMLRGGSVGRSYQLRKNGARKANKSRSTFLWNMNISKSWKHMYIVAFWSVERCVLRGQSLSSLHKVSIVLYTGPQRILFTGHKASLRTCRVLIQPITAAVFHMDLSPWIRANIYIYIYIKDSGGVVQSNMTDVQGGKPQAITLWNKLCFHFTLHSRINRTS